MNKLVLLSEVRKEKNKDNLLKFNKDKSVQEDSNSLYVTFKEKFDFFQNKEGFMDLNCGGIAIILVSQLLAATLYC